MNCLPCFNKDDDDDEETENQAESATPAPASTPPKKGTSAQPPSSTEPTPISSNVKAFNFRELAMATKNFRQECLIGEGGFGRVFKGKLKTGEIVAVKQLDRNGMQGNQEFENVVAALSLFQHPNLIKLVGYCANGDQRLLVHEFMEMGSLDKHLFADDPDKKPMDWFTRMKVAAGAAQGLEYLHDTANPPIIFRDLKPTNILLDENYEPKLSDFCNAKLGAGGNMHPTSRVMGTYGYSAPEYSSGGDLTQKSDIYSFGVVLLELITGRRAVDTSRPNDEQNLVTWAQPIFREPKRFPDLADPRLNKEFPVTGLNQAVGICAMCLQEESAVRPLVADLVAALSFLSMPQPIPAPSPATPDNFSPPPEQKMDYPNAADGSKHDNSSSSDSEDEESVKKGVPEHPEGGNHAESDYSSEENSSYSEADSADLEDDEEEVDVNANVPNSNRSKSRKRGVGNLSSRHGNSKRSSSAKRTGSTRRKVTFKEPHLSSKRNGSQKLEYDESSSSIQRVDSEANKEGSRSSSQNSSESEDDEKRSHRREKRTKDRR